MKVSYRKKDIFFLKNNYKNDNCLFNINDGS